MAARLINFKAIVTVLLGAVYVGTLVWAMVNGKMDAQSFIAGIGPSFGMALGYWFRDTAGG
jgi:hypothetical protein